MPGKKKTLEDDPDIMAARKKNLLWEIWWERFLIVMRGLNVALKLFGTEAVALVSAIGTLAVGWSQIQKRFFTARKEVRAARKEFGPSKPQEDFPRQFDKKTVELNGGNYEVILDAKGVQSFIPIPAFYADPMTLIGIASFGITIWSGLRAWARRKKLGSNLKLAMQETLGKEKS